VTFRTRAANEWKSVTADDIFKADRGGIFPTRGIHANMLVVHVPRYNELAPAFYAMEWTR